MKKIRPADRTRRTAKKEKNPMRESNPASRFQKQFIDSVPESVDPVLREEAHRKLGVQHRQTSENLDWLFANMHPYFFITMGEETQAILNLAARLHDISNEKKITLTDQDENSLWPAQTCPDPFTTR
jgi:hypothetical protein